MTITCETKENQSPNTKPLHRIKPFPTPNWTSSTDLEARSKYACDSKGSYYLYTTSMFHFCLEIIGSCYSKAKMFNRTSAVNFVLGLYIFPE